MALYAGESVLIAATMADFGNNVLTDDDITAMTAKVYDADGETVLEEVTMEWSDFDGQWEYRWDTAGVPAGTYRVKVRAVGPEETISWEYGRVRLATDPMGGV